MEYVVEIKDEIPPDTSFHNKNYKLITLGQKDIGVIDLISNYPDKKTIY